MTVQLQVALWRRKLGELREVALDCHARHPPQYARGALRVPHTRCLKGPDPEVAGGDSDDGGCWFGAVATNLFAGGEHRQAPGSRDTRGIHKLTEQELTQRCRQWGLAVGAGARVRSGAYTLDVKVQQLVGVGAAPLTQQDGAPVTHQCVEAAELVAGVELGDRMGVGISSATEQKLHASGGAEPGNVQTQFGGQGL